MHLLGIDIGGTKIKICVGDEKGNIFYSEDLQTQPFHGAEKALPAIFAQVEKCMQKIKDIQAIGLSCPGPIDQKKGMLLYPPNLKGWENTQIVSLFEKKFSLPVFFNNDANCAALAEWMFANQQKVQNFVYLTTSSGMGGGIIIDGKLVQGETDTAGEVGHIILDIHSPLMTGGLRGTFEAFCGGISVAKQIQEDLHQSKIDTKILELADNKIENISMEHLIEAVQSKDGYAEKIWDQFIERLAQGIGILLMTLNPERIILGTIAVHSKDLLFKPLKEKLPKYAWKEPIEACYIGMSEIHEKMSELSAISIALYGLKKNTD